MPQTDSDKLKAFVQKMHDQGADGFAAGPWSIGPDGAATPQTVGSSYSRPSRTHRFGTSGRRLTDRILKSVALLSITAIIVGIGGIYLTEEPGQPLVAAGDNGFDQAPLGQADEKQLRAIKQKLLITTNRLDSLAAEFRRLKHPAKTATSAAMERLQALENRLVLTVTRLDTLSAEILDLKHTNVILAATLSAPPAAIPHEAGIPDHSRAQTIPPAQSTPVTRLVAEQPQRLAEPAPAPIPASSPEPLTETVTAIGPTAELKPETVAAVSPAPEPLPETVTAVSPLPEPMPETVAAAKPAPEPKPAPLQTGNTSGDWVVNIASYTRQKTATRYVAELQQAGISAEKVEVTVNGRHIHRVRVAGLATRSAARARAGALKQELGLPDIWIGKR